jgi:hypothetical protein
MRGIMRFPAHSTGWNRPDDLIRIVRDELPATVTFDLWVGAERIWPLAEQVAVQSGQRAGTPVVSNGANQLPAPGQGLTDG